jgi:hypothetical protein
LAEGRELGEIDRRQLPGLQALGFWDGKELTEVGRALLSGHSHLPASIGYEKWRLEGNSLHVPYPPDWALLWELEAYLDPVSAGLYSLTPDALRLAAQRGAMAGRETTPPTAAAPTMATSLPAILERGTGAPPPDDLLHRLASQPVIRIYPGPMIEFSDPGELLRLRQSASWRRELDRIVSPRHVLLDPWNAPRLLRRLYDQGLVCESDLESLSAGLPPLETSTQGLSKQSQRRDKGKTLSKGDRAYLLSLLLIAEGLMSPFAPPPGLMGKLVDGLDAALRASAAHKATRALAELAPAPKWVPEEEVPPTPEPELIAALQRAIDKEETVDVLYHVYGRRTPEYRHLSPLLVEQRGPRYYLIAYCHTRRANRTFRLDRLRLAS